MERDLRQTDLWREIEEYFTRVYSPAFRSVSGAADPSIAPDGRQIAFTGYLWEKLEGQAQSRICVVDTETGDLKKLTRGPGEERLPEWSSDGNYLAFLSDRAAPANHQLYLLETKALGEAIVTALVDGTVEYFWWSPDGSKVLVAVAGPGADLAGGQGSGTTAERSEELPTWMPSVEGEPSDGAWRSLHVYDLQSQELKRVGPPGLNIWEAVWCGGHHIAAIASEDPGEEAWYEAPLVLFDLNTDQHSVVYKSDRQLGWISCNPTGSKLAVVEALCSDRWIVAGDVVVIDSEGGQTTRIDSLSVDVTQVVWRDEDRLFFIGIRGLETVAGEIDVTQGKATETWASAETCGTRYPEAAPLPNEGFALVLESYARYPEIAVVSDGGVETIRSFEHDGSAYVRSIAGSVEEVTWRAPDGLEIQALLCKPDKPGPHPLVVNVHGGPVWAYRNKWQLYYPWVPLLVSRGFAVVHVNPRGSSGRGQEFAEAVYGDMGGADAYDFLTGIDALVQRGLVDPDRVGVAGGSYGGFMSAWLVTQTDRFAAAVAMAPVTDWHSQHFTSNIPHFDKIFLDADPYAPAGRYFERSPVMFASRVSTPVLLTAGLKDRCTPAGQAIEFHQALREHGVESELVLYPEEGHGVRNFPALIDLCVRMVGWFERHMPPS